LPGHPRVQHQAAGHLARGNGLLLARHHVEAGQWSVITVQTGAPGLGALHGLRRYAARIVSRQRPVTESLSGRGSPGLKYPSVRQREARDNAQRDDLDHLEALFALHGYRPANVGYFNYSLCLDPPSKRMIFSGSTV
jgi:hypothetical protein